MEGNVQVQLHTGDIPSVFERFSDLIGDQHWRKRVDLLKAEIKGTWVSRPTTLLKSPSRLKSETVIGGGLCSDTGSTAFNGSYVGAFKSVAFGNERSVVDITDNSRSRLF